MPLINTFNPTYGYEDWSIVTFPDWRSLRDTALKMQLSGPGMVSNRNFERFINGKLNALQGNAGNFSSYGLFGKHPRTYKEAIDRDKFIYYEEYKKIKQKVEKEVAEKLRKSSIAESMKPKLVFNDKEIGEFVFDRAAMSLVPDMYYYSPSQKREIDAVKETIITKDDGTMFLESDKSKVVFAFKVNRIKSNYTFDELGSVSKKTKKIDGEIFNSFESKIDVNLVGAELVLFGYDVKDIDGNIWVRKNKDFNEEKVVFVEVDGEESLRKATKMGIIECSSNNKKVYLYKEKKPRIMNSVKIIVGLQMGGFTSWINDFYTGLTAAIICDVLEGLGYSVAIEIAVGGGRCGGCWKKLNFNGKRTHGRRFFTFTAKDFNSQTDMDGLLYTLCDPSFHNVKFVGLLNHFFSFFGDEIDANPDGNPAGTWHGISRSDMSMPIGLYHINLENKKGNKQLLPFYIHGIANENAVLQEILDIALTCENINKDLLMKTENYDFGENQ